jgi:hypothetical protein
VRSTKLLAMVAGFALCASTTAAPPVPVQFATALTQAQGRTLLDLNGDGAFELQGALDASAYFIACDTRLDEFQDVVRVWRTALEFDVSQFVPRKEQKSILSAHLVVQVAGSRNLKQQNPDGTFAPATWTLNAYTGDGVVDASDALQSQQLVVDLSAPAESIVEIDVTEFIKDLLNEGSSFAGFTLQIPSDYIRNNFQDSQIYAKDDELYNVSGPRLVVVQVGRKPHR